MICCTHGRCMCLCSRNCLLVRLFLQIDNLIQHIVYVRNGNFWAFASALYRLQTLCFFWVCFVILCSYGRKKGHKWNEDHDFQTLWSFFHTLSQHCLGFSSLPLCSIPNSTDGFLNVMQLCMNFRYFLCFSLFEIFNLVFVSMSAKYSV